MIRNFVMCREYYVFYGKRFKIWLSFQFKHIHRSISDIKEISSITKNCQKHLLSLCKNSLIDGFVLINNLKFQLQTRKHIHLNQTIFSQIFWQKYYCQINFIFFEIYLYMKHDIIYLFIYLYNLLQ